MICRNMNRQIHIDYCRSEDPSACSGTDIQHITSDLHPNPDRAKDFTSHALHWRRKGDLCLTRLRRVYINVDYAVGFKGKHLASYLI